MKKPSSIMKAEEDVRVLEILKRRAEALAEIPEDDTYRGNLINVFAFELAGESYGIEAEYIQKLIPIREITPIPHAPKFIRGLFNYRSGLYTLIDPSSFFDIQSDGDHLEYILLIKVNGMEVGLLINNFSRLKEVREGETSRQLPLISGKLSEYITGITDENIVLLNIEKFLAGTERSVNKGNN